MAGKSQTRAPLYRDHNLAAFGAEYLRNGGNGSAAVLTLWPDQVTDKRRAYQVGVIMKRSKLVADMINSAASRAQASVSVALERYGVTADHAALEMARLAYTELRQVVDWGSTVDPKTGKRESFLRVRDAVEIDPDAHKALVEITRKADGSLTVKLADKRAAQMDLARLKGWVQDKPTDTTQAVQLVIQR